MSLRARVSWNSLISFLSLTGLQIVKFVSSVVFVNVAGAAAVGVYYVFVSVYRVLNRATTLGMGQAIVKRVSEREDSKTGEIANTVATAFLLRAVPVLTVTVLLLLQSGRIDRYVGLDQAWLFIIAAMILTLVYSTLRSTLLGNRQVDIASGFDLLRDVGTALVQITLVFLGYAAWGLVIGFVLGLLVAGISLFMYVRVPLHSATLEFAQAKSLFSFAKFSYLDDLVGGEHRWLDVIILGFFVPTSSIGVYGVVYALAQFGLVFSAALGRNVLPEASHLSSTERPEARDRLLYRSLSYSTLFPFPILVGTFVVADRLLLDIYALDTGATSLVVLAAGVVAYSAYQQLHQLIYALDLPEYAFALSALSTVVNGLMAIALVPLIGILGAAVSTSLSMGIVFVTGLYLVHKRSEMSLRLPISPWGLQVGCATLMGVLVFVVRSEFVFKSRFYSVLLVLVGVCVYLPLVVSVDPFLRRQLRQLFSRVVP